MKQMEYTVISGTEMNVSRIAQGTWAIGGWMWGGTDERESTRTIHAALDKGINLIDTAPVYGFGVPEEIVSGGLKLRFVRFSGQALTQGVENRRIDGVPVRIY